MAAASSRRSTATAPVMRFQRPSAPLLFNTSSFTDPSPSTAFASSTAYYSTTGAPNPFLDHRRSASPPRVTLHAPSVRFSVDRSMSPRRSIAAPPPRSHVVRKSSLGMPKRTCLCSPTTHPGSFRCALHKNTAAHSTILYPPNRLNMRRSAMTNSLVRIGTVEGDLVRRALAALIRPSSHQQRRRADFQPRPSRLSVMSTVD